MKHTLIKSALAAVLMTGLLNVSEAASVTLNPNEASVTIGSTVTFSYDMDFTDNATFGGGTDFWYDPAILQFVGWSFTSTGTDDPFYQRAPDDCVTSSDPGCGFDNGQFGPGLAQLNGMAFGNDSSSGVAGPETIGFMVFNTIAEGVATIQMAANDDGVSGNPGPFVSTTTFQVMDVTFNPGTVTVTAVPVPAAIWFMVSGLGMLGGLRRFA